LSLLPPYLQTTTPVLFFTLPMSRLTTRFAISFGLGVYCKDMSVEGRQRFRH